MASMDYGVIVKKNNILMKSRIFKDMEKSVGCYIEGVKGKYSAYIGDKDIFVAVYKTHITVFANGVEVKRVYRMEDDFLPYKKYKLKFEVDGVNFTLKRLGESQFRLRFIHKDIEYLCVYGYGIGKMYIIGG